MKTNVLSSVMETQKEVQLIKGEFTPSEASEIIGALIDQKINFHEVRKFQRWESNHDCGTEDLNTRIDELKAEKAKAKSFINGLEDAEYSIKINGVLEITVTEINR
ncbi:hypothetical protein [Robertkochia flava]|uniref:hypothetical protein n=1 Tax=Robertkochia flava TaxID=3447986 RepID=UPI001CCAB927|nr:hypothetical protein [Robertkochia marina]